MIFDVIKKAKQLLYDNKNSGLDVNNVQDAIDELTQAIVEVDAINEASGSPILLTDTIDDSLLDFKVYGRSTQVQYSGKNKYKRINGYYYDDSGNRVASSGWDCSDYIECNENENYTFSCTQGGQLGYWSYYDENKTLISREKMTNNQTITTPSGCKYLTIFLHGTTFTTPNTNVQIEKGTTVTEYEPYVGGVASPNPDYPQAIKSVADSGYFDGELLQGMYNTSGVFTSSTDICSKNPIPCKEGDIIKLIYGEVVPAIAIAFYDENMAFISRPYEVNTNEYETIAPTNAKYMKFHIDLDSNTSATPQTVKHITVTINGNYALIVKSKGKNLLKSNIDNQTLYGVTFTNNADGSIAVNGTSTLEFSVTINDSLKLSKGAYIINGNPYNDTVTRLGVRVNEQWYFDYGSGKEFIVQEDTYVKVSMVFKQGCTFNTAIYPMIRPLGTDDTYEPYKETVTYIPLSEPLRSSIDRSVTDDVSLTEDTRRFTEVVFDGSEDEGWKISATDLYTSAIANVVKKPASQSDNSNALCDRFVCYSPITFNTEKNNGNSCMNVGTNGNVVFFKNDITTVDAWKTWLQANPITVVYELAELITEEIETDDIVTYNNVTHLTASDNANMWVEYYSNSSVGQRLAKVDKKVLELDTVKELYKTATVKARMNGKIIELTGTVCTENELNQCLAVLRNKGYDPDNVIALCMYNTGGDNIIGRLSIIGNYVVVSDINNENFISDYTLTFNVMYMIKE